MKNISRLLTVLVLILFLGSCGSKKESSEVKTEASSEVPVKVRKLKGEEFNQFENFTSSLIGLRESSKYSSVSGTVESVQVKVGDFVEEGQTIVSFPKNNPSINYYQSKASFKAAESAYFRMKELYGKNGVSQQQFEQAETQYNVQAANWETVSDMTEVKAPITGYITQLQIKATDNVNPGDLLFTVSNYDTLTSVIWVPDRQIAKIDLGQRALALWEGTTLKGEVTQVDLSKNADKKAFAVHLQFENPGRVIPSGVTADISVTTWTEEDAIVLHKNEIISEYNGDFAFVVEGDSAVKKEITLGVHQGFYYKIENGLNIGDLLVTEGVFKLSDNDLVNVINDDATKLAKSVN